jgi:hypothetical protein
MNLENESAAMEAALLADRMKQGLASRPPEVVGAVVGQLLATFVAGHAPLARKLACQMVTAFAEDLVPLIVEEMIAEGRAPEHWRSGIAGRKEN